MSPRTTARASGCFMRDSVPYRRKQRYVMIVEVLLRTVENCAWCHASRGSRWWCAAPPQAPGDLIDVQRRIIEIDDVDRRATLLAAVAAAWLDLGDLRRA